MKIYTKKGDAGETGLYGGDRVAKDHLRIHAYGTLDELNAFLGAAISALADDPSVGELRGWLTRIQGELFQLGAELATPIGKKVASALVEEKEVAMLETEIDAMEQALPPLRHFILPGGTPIASHIHCARAVARRAERELVSLGRQEEVRPVALKYLNRLSDALFVCARYANHLAGVADVPWLPPAKN